MFFKRRATTMRTVDHEDSDDLGYDQRELERALFKASRYVAKHQEIDRSQLDGGLGRAAGVEGNGWAFDFFEKFGHYLERFTMQDKEYFIGPWVMERRADPFDPRDYNDGPAIAVNFRLFYNAQEVGIVRFKPTSWFSAFGDNDAEVRSVVVASEVDFAAMLPYDHVSGLLMLLGERLAYDEDGLPSKEYYLSVSRSLQEVLWETQRRRTHAVRLDFFHSGHAHLSYPFQGE